MEQYVTQRLSTLNASNLPEKVETKGDTMGYCFHLKSHSKMKLNMVATRKTEQSPQSMVKEHVMRRYQVVCTNAELQCLFITGCQSKGGVVRGAVCHGSCPDSPRAVRVSLTTGICFTYVLLFSQIIYLEQPTSARSYIIPPYPTITTIIYGVLCTTLSCLLFLFPHLFRVYLQLSLLRSPRVTLHYLS